MCLCCSTCLLARIDEPSTDLAAAGAHASWHAEGQKSVPNSLLTGLRGLRSTQDECYACRQGQLAGSGDWACSSPDWASQKQAATHSCTGRHSPTGLPCSLSLILLFSLNVCDGRIADLASQGGLVSSACHLLMHCLLKG